MQTYFIRDQVMYLDSALREYRFTIKDMPQHLQPREKLMSHGPGSLTIRELLAVLLNTGTSKEEIMSMSERIVRDYGEKSLLSQVDANKLSVDMDIPLSKACQIVACGELGRRIYEKSPTGSIVIRSAKDVYDHFHDMRNLNKEHLRGLYLNSHNKIIREEVISIGTVNSNMIHPREVFRPALECSAAAVILAHNHPSGESVPSQADIEVTEQIIQAGRILGIAVLDHVIITKDGFASVKANY